MCELPIGGLQVGQFQNEPIAIFDTTSSQSKGLSMYPMTVLESLNLTDSCLDSFMILVLRPLDGPGGPTYGNPSDSPSRP
jgi:hypothetical protein